MEVLLWIPRSITKNLWVYLVITTLMNRYPYKQLQIILTTLTNPAEN